MIATIMTALATAAASPSFCVVVTEDKGEGIAILDPAGTLRKRIEIGHWPHELDIDGSGTTAFVTQFGITDYDSRLGTPGDHVSRVDLASGRETGRIVLPTGHRAPHGVKFRPRSSEVFVNTEVGGDRMFVYDAGSLEPRRQFALPPGTHNFIFSDDGARLYSFAGAGGVSIYDPDSGRLIMKRVTATPARGLRWMPDGGLAVAGKGEVYLLDPDTLDIRQTLIAPVKGQIIYLEILADGTIVAPSLSDNGVVWFGKAGPKFIPTGPGSLTARLAPDGLIYITNVGGDHLTRLNQQGEIVDRIGSGLIGPNAVGFGACPAADAPAAASDPFERG